MRLLLDTHTFLWFVENNPMLSSTALAHIQDGSNEIYLSIASVWEIAIKISIGKLEVVQPLEQFLANQMMLNRISPLNITMEHAALVATLPMHHRDPFDRLLVTQAMVEQTPIVSRDVAFDM
jgi:PIN domain nuclease of toxin-antitoxin system